MTQVSSNVGTLTEQAEQLQSLLSTFDVGGSTTRAGAADASAGADVVVGDGGRPE